jgi:predicted HTH domain antitoxin
MLPSIRQNIAAEVHLFNTLELKENFLFILGALMMRLVSLQKASEILNIEPDAFLKILDLMNIEFSFLTGSDTQTERVGLKPQL